MLQDNGQEDIRLEEGCKIGQLHLTHQGNKKGSGI